MSSGRKKKGSYGTYAPVPTSDPRDHPLFLKERQERILAGEEPGSLAGSCRRNPIIWTIGILSILAVLGISIWAIVNSATGSWASFGDDDDWDGDNKPHIIYILADDLGWNSMGYRDYDLSYVSPTLTSLAQSGVIIDQFYAQEVCTPGRASLLTGRYPLSVGMQYSMVQTAIPWGMDLKETTIASVLQDNDYATHALGKWHLGHYSPRYLPTARGFDTFFGYLNGESYYWSKRNPDHTVFHDLLYSTEECYTAYKEEDMHDYSTFLYRDKAKEIIEEHANSSDNKSLFMYLALQAVHDPFVDIGLHESGMPIEYLDYDVYSKIVDKETGVVGRKRRQYAMALSVMDSAIADIIDTLDKTDMLSNTVIIFSSDNGGCFGSGGKNGPLRGTKGSMFEGGTKVDSFMWSPLFPKKVQGTVYSNLFHISDMFPTMLAMTGTDFTPEEGYELDGFNHFPAILGESSSAPREYMLYNYYYKVDTYMFDININGSFGVRDKQYKLMHTFNSSTYALWYQPESSNSDDDAITEENRCSSSMNNDGEFTFWLFDLENDPFEETNLYDSQEAEHVSAKETLYAKLDEYAENAFEVTNDFSANRASFQVWRSHDNWMVPYAKSEDFDDSKGGNYPHDDFEESCFDDRRRRRRDRALLGPGAEAEAGTGAAARGNSSSEVKLAAAGGTRRIALEGNGKGVVKGETKRNTETHHTQRVILELIQGLTSRRQGPPLVHGFANEAYQRRHLQEQHGAQRGRGLRQQ